MPFLPNSSSDYPQRNQVRSAHRRRQRCNRRFESLETRNLLAAIPVINEFMAANESTLIDGDGATSDWIELHNRGDEPVDLTGWHLSDDPEELDKWTFAKHPDETENQLQPGEFKIVFASGAEAPDANYFDGAGFVHTSFRLDKDGEYLALSNSEGVISEFGSSEETFPQQFADVSFGLDQITAQRQLYFLQPTPGEGNGEGLVGIVTNKVEVDRSSGTFHQPFSLALSTDHETGVIRYTTDGSIPNVGSSIYSEPLNIDETTQVRSRVFLDGHGPGPIRSDSYLRLADELADFDSALPILVIENFAAGRVPNKRAHNPPAGDGGNIKQVERQLVELQFFDRQNGTSSLSHAPDLTTRAGVRVRGSSSANFRKQSLTVETWDDHNQELSISPFNMPSESDWILYAPSSEFDRTMLHNSFVYELSRQIGRYAVRFQFVEVFLNTDGGQLSENDHAGVYLWMEKIKRDADRVDIDRLSRDGSTGGWMLQSNRMQPIPVDGTEHPPNFHTKGPNRRQQGPYGRTFTGGNDQGGDDIPTGYNTFLNFESPRSEDINQKQIDSITLWFEQFEDALYGPDFTDPEKGYRAYIDVGSFIDHALLTNLALSFDALQLSTYMFKRSENSKLELGPIWDFDRAYGADTRAADPTTNLEYPKRFLWMPQLFKDPNFAQAYQDRWQQLREGAFATENLHAIIDRQAAEITEQIAEANGTSRWPSKLDSMKDWLARRVEAIDDLYTARPQFDTESGDAKVVLPGTTVKVSSSDGAIYYTSDGTDPRLPSGGVNPSAIEAAGGIAASEPLVAADAAAAAIVPTEAFHQEFAMSWTESIDFDDSQAAGWKQGTMGVGFDENDTYHPLLGLDLLTEMVDVNGSLYARIKFPVQRDQVAGADFLRLNMRYDDGFIAFINGVEVAKANAPSDPTWNSTASAPHRDSLATQFEAFNIDLREGILHEGTNVLAIHGMNRRASGNDMLVQAELLSGSFNKTPIQVGTQNVIARTFLNGSWSGPVEIPVAKAGDANADGTFDSKDLIQVFQAGEYEDQLDGNSTFAEGDWDLDGDFTSRDLVAAFTNGNYVAQALRPALHLSAVAGANLNFESTIQTHHLLHKPVQNPLSNSRTDITKVRPRNLEHLASYDVDKVFASRSVFAGRSG